VASSAVIHVPVTLETRGIRGGWIRTWRNCSANGARAGSIMAEWKAWDVWRYLPARSRVASVWFRASTADAGPETTHA